MLPIVWASASSVLKVFGVCALGAWLAHRSVLSREARRSLSRAILYVMLPGLLVSKVAGAATWENLVRWAVLPAAAFVYIGLGFAAGRLLLGALRLPEELRRVAVAATAFGNSGYMPLPLVAAVAGSAPLFAGDPGAADRGMAYVSIYLVVMSPCLWGIAYPYLSGQSVRDLPWSQIVTPPMVAAVLAVLLGAWPPLHALFVAKGAPLRLALDVADTVGAAAVPCALLVLGANVLDGVRVANRVPAAAVAAVCAGRLVLVPLAGCLATLAMRRAGLLPADPMFALVLMLEGAVPAATNLIVMCQVHHRGEDAMANLLFWNYLVAVPTLTAFIAFFLWVLGNP